MQTPTELPRNYNIIQGSTIKSPNAFCHSSMVCVRSKIAKKTCYYVGVQLYDNSQRTNIIIISYITLKTKRKKLIRIKHEKV